MEQGSPSIFTGFPTPREESSGRPLGLERWGLPRTGCKRGLVAVVVLMPEAAWVAIAVVWVALVVRCARLWDPWWLPCVQPVLLCLSFLFLCLPHARLFRARNTGIALGTVLWLRLFS